MFCYMYMLIVYTATDRAEISVPTDNSVPMDNSRAALREGSWEEHELTLLPLP